MLILAPHLKISVNFKVCCNLKRIQLLCKIAKVNKRVIIKNNKIICKIVLVRKFRIYNPKEFYAIKNNKQNRCRPVLVQKKILYHKNKNHSDLFNKVLVGMVIIIFKKITNLKIYK